MRRRRTPARRTVPIRRRLGFFGAYLPLTYGATVPIRRGDPRVVEAKDLMDAHETDGDGVGAAPSVARLLLELRAQVTIDVRSAGKTVQVRPQGVNAVAVYIHPGGVDLAVEPDRANE